MPKRSSGRKTQIAVIAAIVLGLAYNIRIAVISRAGWGVDFNQFYLAGKVTGTGHLYDWDATRLLTGRLPVVLYGHKILGHFPYRVGQFIWMALGIAAFIGFAYAWPGLRRPAMMVALAWSTPAAMVILFGQDTAFWLAFFAAGLLLMERKKPWAAGIAFSLCICKFHLALGIPVMLAAQKRWKTMIAGAISVSVLILCCFLIEGTQWPLRYAAMAHLTEFAPGPEVMPNLTVITDRLPWPVESEIIGALATLVFLWVACRGIVDAGMAGAAAAACGLLVGHHALFADTVLLIPLAVLTIQHGAPRLLKALAVLILSPAPFALGSVLQRSLIWQIWIAPFVVIAILAAIANAKRTVGSPPERKKFNHA